MNDKEDTGGMLWIIGYGNVQRRDDGAGPYVAHWLRRKLADRAGILIQTPHQLDPVLVDDGVPPRAILFIDATPDRLEQGWRFRELMPDASPWPFALHHLPPGMFLELLGRYHRYHPFAWLVTIQGDDFGFGGGLTAATEERADRAAAAIADFGLRKIIDSTGNING